MNFRAVSIRSAWWKNIRQSWPELRSALSQPELKSLAVLVALCFLLLIMLDVATGMLKFTGYLSPEVVRFYRISEQGSAGEFAGYVTSQMAVIFIMMTALRLKSSLHMMIAMLVQYMLLDDMFMLHEMMGSDIAAMFFAGKYLVPAQALGELCFGVGFCAAAVAVFAFSLRTTTPYLRSLAFLLFAPLCLLAVCAIGVDFFHALVPRSAKYLDGLVALLEDGGELLAMFILMLVAAAQWIASGWISPRHNGGVISP